MATVTSVNLPSPTRVYLKRAAFVMAQLAFVVLLVLLWQHATSSGWVDPFFFGHPSQVWRQLVDWANTGTLWDAVWTTAQLLAIGFAAGLAIGIAIGAMLGFSRLFRDVMEPFIVFFNAIPRIVLYPFLIVWFGFGVTPQIILVILVITPTVAINVAAGFREVQGEYLDSLRAQGASKVDVARQVYIPSLTLWVLTTCRVTFALAFQAVVVAQLIISTKGVGYLITEGKVNYNVDVIYGAMVIVVVMAVSFDLLLSAIERRATRWMPEH